MEPGEEADPDRTELRTPALGTVIAKETSLVVERYEPDVAPMQRRNSVLVLVEVMLE